MADGARIRAVLPPLTPIPGLDIKDPRDLLTPEQRAALKADLARMARQRRRAEVEGRNIALP